MDHGDVSWVNCEVTNLTSVFAECSATSPPICSDSKISHSGLRISNWKTLDNKAFLMVISFQSFNVQRLIMDLRFQIRIL